MPHTLVGEEVRVQWDDRLLRVYAHGKCVAVHSRTPAGTFATRKEHRPDHKPAREEAYVAGLLGKAEHIGADALEWSKAACEERGVRAYRLLQGMLSSPATIRESASTGPAGCHFSAACFAIKS